MVPGCAIQAHLEERRMQRKSTKHNKINLADHYSEIGIGAVAASLGFGGDNKKRVPQVPSKKAISPDHANKKNSGDRIKQNTV
jgi:hypothetical protein